MESYFKTGEEKKKRGWRRKKIKAKHFKLSVVISLEAQGVCSFNMGRETPPAVVY